MADAYRRRCKNCDRWISLRQMPAGQWVAFEDEQPHDCKRAPTNVTRPKPRPRTHVSNQSVEMTFEEIEIPSDEKDVSVSSAARVRSLSSTKQGKTKTSVTTPLGAAGKKAVKSASATPNPAQRLPTDAPKLARTQEPEQKSASGWLWKALFVLFGLYMLFKALFLLAR